MTRRLFYSFFIVAVLLLALAPSAPHVRAATPPPPVEDDLQGWLDAQPGVLKSFQDGDRSAAEIVDGASSYYGLSPRVVLALLEATASLLSDSAPPDQALRQPFGRSGPDGFAAQIDWAVRDLRAGFGPYERPPVVAFTDGTTLTLALAQAPEGIAVQRFLARGRSQTEWRAAVDRFGQAFQRFFDNQLPDERHPQPVVHTGFLRRPWAAGTRVVHLAYFDHMFPTVDTGRDDNGYVVNYLGHGSVQYDGHDGHDFYFPDQPIGTYILAAADGIAHASTHRGRGVWIEHASGYVSVYWHLDKFSSIFRGKLNSGQGVRVRAGELIGSSGKTGFVKGTPHLHFEVRHNGRQVDPYGWFGSGSDPCVAYAACEASTWLWDAGLTGEFDFAPPDAPAPPDQTPPAATLTAAPPDDLLFLARFDGSALQHVGAGTPAIDGAPAYHEAIFGQGLRASAASGVSFPTAGNLSASAGTIALWAVLPSEYRSGTGRAYLFAASANADEGPIYTGTLALRRDQLGPGGAPRWDFWTTPEDGEVARDDLAVPDTLEPGPHHFAISWDRARRTKALYIDGERVASATNAVLPADVGPTIELGRWMPGAGLSGAVLDDLAIFNRALEPFEIAALAASATPLQAGSRRIANPSVRLDTNAADDAGGIVGVQLGLNGIFDAPQPYADDYELRLPSATGIYTVAARFFDRADNSTTISTTIELVAPPWPTVHLEDQSALGATLVVSPTAAANLRMQISHTPDFVGAIWQPLPERLPWSWPPAGPPIAWVRFRDTTGLQSSPLPLTPNTRRTFLPGVLRP